MHLPPAASYSFDRHDQPWWFILLTLLAGGAVCLVLGMQQSVFVGWILLGVAFGVACAGMAFGWTHAPEGQLVFDGNQWTCTAWPQHDVARIFIGMDFQSRLLIGLNLVAQPRTRWLWLSRRTDAYQWHALRCALVSFSQ